MSLPISENDSATTRSGVYLLHFDQAYKHAEHYMGWAKNIELRVEQHRKGNGARLMTVLKQAGISFTIARLWPDATRTDERTMKVQGAKRLCPICYPDSAMQRKNDVGLAAGSP